MVRVLPATVVPEPFTVMELPFKVTAATAAAVQLSSMSSLLYTARGEVIDTVAAAVDAVVLFPQPLKPDRVIRMTVLKAKLFKYFLIILFFLLTIINLHPRACFWRNPYSKLLIDLITLYMVVISTALSYVFGLPLGVIMVTTADGHVLESRGLNRVLGVIINAARSIPFIIFLILVIPFTRLVVGTSIGTAASMVPLTLAAIPFVARLVETSLKEIDQSRGHG